MSASVIVETALSITLVRDKGTSRHLLWCVRMTCFRSISVLNIDGNVAQARYSLRWDQPCGWWVI